MHVIKWITINKMADETGYTIKALRDKISKGVWAQGTIWRKAPDNRILFNREEYNKWAVSKPQI